MSKKFTNTKDLERYLAKTVLSSVVVNDDVRKEVGKKNTEKVFSEVYAKYTPEEYERRGVNGGLADERNIEIVDEGVAGNKVLVVFENTTMGNDSMEGKYISDTIENGIESNWEKTGEWSEPRPFIDAMREELRSGNELSNALKESLRKSGLQVK